MATRPRALPEWTTGAWTLLDEDEILQCALTFWHQGVHLTTEFPSFALVAFAAAVEAMSRCRAFRDRLGAPPEACSSCGNVPQATARFWSTVRLVVSKEELRELRQGWDIYDGRSQVAHGSTTHGFETALGPVFLFSHRGSTDQGGPSFIIDETDGAQQFVLQELPRFTALVSRLLLHALGGGANRGELLS